MCEITIDLSRFDFRKCPVWYQNLSNSVNKTGEISDEEYSQSLSDNCGFDVRFTVRTNESTKPAGYLRVVEGKETEITMMMLKWS